MTVIILYTAVLAIAIIKAYKYILHPALFSPLAKLPHAHWSCRVSSRWIDWHADHKTDNEAIHRAHEKLGPIVRIGKNEVSVNHIDGVKEIYNGPCNRDAWYQFARNYGVDNMFSYGDKAPHTTRRRVLGNVYAKSTLHSSENLPRYATQLIKRQLLPFIYWRESRGESVDAISLFLDFATDFITSYIFGSGNTADFLGKERMPLICNNCAELDEAPERVRKGEGDARHSTEGVALTLMNNLENLRDHAPGQNATSTEPVVLKRLSQNLFAQIDTTKCPGPSNLKFTIASELQDHIIAGTESSGWTMTYIIHELSKRSGLQDKLREEICSLTELDLKNTLSFSPTTVQTLDKLPLLDAIILETMRVYPGIAGSQPRLVPQSSSTFTVLGHLIPPGTVLSAQAYSLHRNAEVFPSPETWDPYRWIEVDSNKRNEMQRWFWAFGSGPRMCIGNFFAMIELKLVIASIYFNFTSHIIKDDGIQQGGGYSSGPTGAGIWFGFHKI